MTALFINAIYHTYRIIEISNVDDIWHCLMIFDFDKYRKHVGKREYTFWADNFAPYARPIPTLITKTGEPVFYGNLVVTGPEEDDAAIKALTDDDIGYLKSHLVRRYIQHSTNSINPYGYALIGVPEDELEPAMDGSEEQATRLLERHYSGDCTYTNVINCMREEGWKDSQIVSFIINF